MFRGSVVLSRARLLTALAVFAIGGVVAGQLAAVVNPPNPAAGVQMRIGTVVESPAPTAVTAWVQIFEGGDAIEMHYQAGYVPVAGDQVNVLMLGDGNQSGIILGGRAGQAGNLVPNSDFRRHAQAEVGVNDPPYLWAHYNASGQSAFVSGTFSSLYQRHGLTVAINTGVAGVNYVYSSAIPVTAGETLYADLTGDALCFEPNPTTLTTSLVVGFFPDAGSVWPDYMSVTTIASNVTDFSGGDGFWLTGSVTVPDGATHARAAVLASQTSGDLDYTLRVTHIEITRDT